MANATAIEEESEASTQRQLTNDVVIKVATPNGSGSQSANLILMRSIFDMGVPVSGKNLFPSNIQGLPTWYTIRANDKGYLAQRRRTDIFVAMNPDSIMDDIENCDPGSTLIIRKKLAKLVKRDDLNVVVVPFSDLVAKACEDRKLQNKVINVVYVGVVASLLGIDMDVVEQAIAKQFGNKPKAIELNRAAAQVGHDWVEENVSERPPYRIERSTNAKDKMLIEGNEATALGMMFGGVSMASWYPITPSSSVCEYLTSFMKKYRHDPDTGKATYAIVQAEDELAAIGMVLGASWAGARAFTATAGPGISLMAEMAGLSYFAEIPAVIVDVQRMGPSTGLPTRTSQGDILKAYYLSHGDCRHPLLLPGNVAECYEFSRDALDYAAEFQTLVFVMTDLDLGMNRWLSDAFEPPTNGVARGKVLSADDLGKVEEFARYRDVDGDGIPYRTLPGTESAKAAYFTRGTGHTETAAYSEKAENWTQNMDRLLRKFDTIREKLPKPVVDESDGVDIGIIAYGSSDLAVTEGRDMLRDKHGLDTNYMRVRALPVSKEVTEFIERHRVVYLVEQNRDGQMASILRAEFPEYGTKIKSVLHYDGIPLDAESVVEGVLAVHQQ